jgi:hypothetical protein
LAAVIGTEVGFPLLRALAGVPEDALFQHLHQLQSAELLSEVSSHPAAVYAFTHALLQEVAYQSLLTKTRQADHQRLARIIELHFPSRQIATGALAHHHRGGPISTGDRIGAALAHMRSDGSPPGSFGASQARIALLEGMPESDARRQLDLELNITLGPICMVTQG